MSSIEDLGRALRAQIRSIDEVALLLVAAQRSILDVAEHILSLDVTIGLAEAIGAHRRIQRAIDLEVRGRQSLNTYLESIGLVPVEPPTEVHHYIDRHNVGVSIHGGNHDEAQPAFVERNAWILPVRASNDERRRLLVVEGAVRYCQLLADLAAALMVAANVTSGSVSLAIQKVAASLRQPLVAAGVEVASAAANASHDGKDPVELTGQLASEKILAMIPGGMAPGLNELKATAFALRSTGILMCLAANRRLPLCPCFPDFLSDMGVGFIDFPPGRDSC